MQAVSSADERAACPNPHSPRSWVPCASLADCGSAVRKLESAADGKVLQLKCSELGLIFPKGACSAGEAYFLANLTQWGGSESGLWTACFLRAASSTKSRSLADSTTDAQGTVCLGPAYLDDMATVFTAADEEIGEGAPASPNDMAICGYNFISYSTLEAMQVTLLP